MHFSMLNNLAV